MIGDIHRQEMLRQEHGIQDALLRPDGTDMFNESVPVEQLAVGFDRFPDPSLTPFS
jgi:hypothetical protein